MYMYICMTSKNILSTVHFLSYLYFAGGRDRRGGAILTFPSPTHPEKLDTDDLRRLMTYLASVPRYLNY